MIPADSIYKEIEKIMSMNKDNQGHQDRGHQQGLPGNQGAPVKGVQGNKPDDPHKQNQVGQFNQGRPADKAMPGDKGNQPNR